MTGPGSGAGGVDDRPPALIGPRSLLESYDRPAWWAPPWAPRRLEAVIGRDNGDQTLTVRHWFSGQARPDNPWLKGDVISAVATGPAELLQRGRPGSDSHELVALVPEAEGVAEYAWPVNAAMPRRWRRTGLVTAPPAHPPRPDWDGPTDAAEWGDGRVVAAATAFTRLKSGWVQALVQVDTSLFHLHRQQRRARTRWLRHACIVLDDRTPFTSAERLSVKLAQVSGERDTQPGRTTATLSASESRSGVSGTDLGVRVEHRGRSFLLFGDTHWWRRSWLGTRDSIAEIAGPDAERPAVTFAGAPLTVRGGGTTMREYDVPLDAFSLDDELYVLLTSNHFRQAQVMGRSVLCRATGSDLVIDPRRRWRGPRLAFLATLSDHRFINVSVHRDGDTLWLWGTGAYRADAVRLARVDLAAPGVRHGLRAGDAGPFLAALRYWAGPAEAPATRPNSTPPDGDGQRWTEAETGACPVFTPCALGELSVRWVPELGRYLMLTMSGPDDPIGPAVVLRTAGAPWGPWSPRLRLMDWIAAGMSFSDPSQRYIRALADGSDPVGDAVFRGQATSTGAAYAPYFFDLRSDGDEWLLRYTLSTWNPYQVVLMQHRLTPADLLVTSHSV